MVLATWFGSGLIKLAPGTCGSLAALPLPGFFMIIERQAWPAIILMF